MGASVIALPETIALPTLGARDDVALRLDVEVRRDLELSADDALAMDGLIVSRPHTGLFLSRAWLAGFFAEPPGHSEPFLLMLKQGTALRGVVALAVRHAITGAYVRLLGGGFGSDRVDLLADRGCEAACADRFVEWLGESFGKKGFVLELRDVAAHSALWGAVWRSANGGSGPLVMQPLDIHTLPYVDLVELRSLYGSQLAAEPFARSLQRQHGRIERRGRFCVDVLQDPTEVESAFESLVQMLRARWQGAQGGSALDNQRAQRFHRRVLPLLLAAGTLRMVRLTCDSRTIAVFYGLVNGRCWGSYQVGYDRQWAGRIHLGKVTFSTAISLAAAEGATKFDFLKGAEGVKYLWPVNEGVTIDAEVYSRRSGAQLTRARRASRELASAVVKSMRDWFPMGRRG